jgi:DNA-binding transcriptional LysR family regulator
MPVWNWIDEVARLGLCVRDLDLKTLRLFKAVCEAGNIKQAAQREHIEASAISKRIAALEEHLGVGLLNRTPRGVHATLAGESLLAHAIAILTTIERIETEIASPVAPKGESVRLLVSSSMVNVPLVEDVSHFMRQSSNRAVSLNIEEFSCAMIAQQLREKKASLGICWNRGEIPGLQSRPYREDELVLAVGTHHPLADCKSLRFGATLGLEHVASSQGTAIQSMLKEIARGENQALFTRALVSTFDFALKIVADGLAVGVVPRQAVRMSAEAHRIRIIALEEPWVKRRFSIFFQNGLAMSKSEQRLLDHLLQENILDCAS